MEVIYHCFGGTHSSVLCAALHLGIISNQHLPSFKELMDCPYFDKVPSSEAGIIHFIGYDTGGNAIYVLGCRGCGPIVEKVIQQIMHILRVTPDKILLVYTTPCLNRLLRIGGFLSRGLGLVTPGRILLYHGTRLAFADYKDLVHAVKARLNLL